MAIEVIDIGLTDYNEAWDYQKVLVDKVKKDRNDGYLVFCEHPSVITLGKNGSYDNIIASDRQLSDLGVSVIENNRGGDVTLHNPGQIVGYPIINLENFKTDLHWFLRTIENSLIDLLATMNIQSAMYEGYTGVWVEQSRKIAAIGMHCSRWVTSHGFALNTINDISEFDYIVPCGIEDKNVTSIRKELELSSKAGTDIDMDNIKNTFSAFFERKLSEK
jgi:lipoyl(octanoyl) transferase